jgi:catechol 2,3-dioxygenase
MEFHRKPHIYVSQVDLKVEDLERSLSFYQDMIGFKILNKTNEKAILSADGIKPLLSIEQPKDVKPKQPRTTGLYHYALLLPNRAELGKVIQHMINSSYPIQGASDHLVSEALYLADPDGNGIEIYADRPSSTWKWENEEVIMTTDRLDIEGLIQEANGEKWEGLPKATIMGHIHLHVSELQETYEFYCKGLGFNLVNRFGNQALFISTGGYHHHIGLNTWNGVGAPPPSNESVGLKRFTLVFPNEESRTNIIRQLSDIGTVFYEEDGLVLTKDPSGNCLSLTIGNNL